MIPLPIAAQRVALSPQQLALLARAATGRRPAPAAVAALERAAAEQLQAVRVVAMSRYAGAMELALRSLDLPGGASALVPEWCATGVLRGIGTAGLVPIAAPCDIDRCTLAAKGLDERLLDPRKGRVAAVVARHVFGQAPHLRSIASTCAAVDVPLIEDAGLAFGAAPVGAVGALAVFDLGPASALTGLGGGLVATRDPTLAARLDELAAGLPEGGFDAGRAARELAPRAGTFLSGLGPFSPGLLVAGEPTAALARMAPAQAELVTAGLEAVPAVVAARTEAAADLTEGLSGLPGVRLQRADRDALGAWAAFSVRHAAEPRELARRLAHRGVATRLPGLVRVGSTRSWSESTLLLPNHQGVSIATRHRIIRVVREVVLELAGL